VENHVIGNQQKRKVAVGGNITELEGLVDRLCGLMVRVPEVPGSTPGDTRFSEK
jgi:hypothetical protein